MDYTYETLKVRSFENLVEVHVRYSHSIEDKEELNAHVNVSWGVCISIFSD